MKIIKVSGYKSIFKNNSSLYQQQISPDSSDGKESTCNARDLVSIPGSDPLEKGMATHSSILARIPGTEEPVGYGPWGCKESDMTEQLTQYTIC